MSFYCLFVLFAEKTGVMTLNAGKDKLSNKLDHETKPLFNMTISAKDGGSPSLTGYTFVVVTVIDVDDNAPQFGKDAYTAAVYENITQGTVVTQVNATDIDTAVAQTIYYQLESGNVGDVFYIGRLNGTVSLKCGSGCLDRETKNQYVMTVAAISIVNQTQQKTTAKVKTPFLIPLAM